eukprot:CAMPEP_0204368872 /NCGR_PEP_ID=MMETSP0469-20131031/44535_1 /ASSEMBLY_ACC=CAM_ASM_000384 /TAXON_ID=2969 /ORGANISM="Oxyrrhis marina" /LENGTH=35 /DNA_ID= /DNA_START= /DNA_END= /DNA_ORIENTATION=
MPERSGRGAPADTSHTEGGADRGHPAVASSWRAPP